VQVTPEPGPLISPRRLTREHRIRAVWPRPAATRGRAVTAASILAVVAVFLIGVAVGLGIGSLAWRRSLRPGHHRWPLRRRGGHR
jgi:hypothetical protein